jgi:hypothetical protein
MKDLSLEQIEELLAKVTPGEWALVVSGNADDGRPAIIHGEYLRIFVDHCENYGDPKPDAEFIAQSKQIVQSLIRRVRAYREVAIKLNCEPYEGYDICDVDAEAERLLAGQTGDGK